MKQLVFTGERMTFVNLYSAFMVGERMIQGVKPLRTAVKIYDKLDSISVKVVIREGQEGRQLKDGPLVLTFEDEEYDLLKNVVTQVLTQCVNMGQGGVRILGAREADMLLQFLDKAEEVKA